MGWGCRCVTIAATGLLACVRPRNAWAYLASRSSITPARGLVFALGFVVMAPVAAAADRVALVIGNSTYATVTRLDNPVNDATDVGAALERLGFQVRLRLDVTEDAMEQELLTFGEESSGAEMALVYYAGHGLEMNGVNYLVPVDAQLGSAAAVRFETVALSHVISATEGARTRMVVLDACRDNPFVRSMRGASRSNVRAGGLAPVTAGGRGLLVAYAAAEGATAADGTGLRNSPYTSALLRHLERPNTDLRVMFGDVGAEVMANTEASQQPFIYTSLSGEHYLKAATTAPAAVRQGEAVAGAGTLLMARAQQETVFWQSIASSGNPADFEAYLVQFPNGTYVTLARNRMAALRTAREPSPTEGAEIPELQETVFWQSIADSENPADFGAYLEQFPRGTYAALARNRLAGLPMASDTMNVRAPLEAASNAPAALEIAPVVPQRLLVSNILTAGATNVPAPLEAASNVPATLEVSPVVPQRLLVSSASTAGAVDPPSDSRPASAEDVSRGSQELAILLDRDLSASQSDDNDWTDLHYAAALNLPELVAFLLDSSNVVNPRLRNDGQPLSDELKQTLQELGYNFRDWTRDGETPLHVAAYVDAGSAAGGLIARGADIDARTGFDWTPLHYAALANAYNAVEVLLLHGADVNARVIDDWTPLHLAVWAGNPEVVMVLLAHGADSDVENRNGDTPADLAESDVIGELLSNDNER